VPPALDHAEKADVMWLHPWSPNGRWPNQTPFRSATVPRAPDLLRSDFALAVERGRVVVLVVRGPVADAVHELARRADRSLHRTNSADGFHEVFDAGDVRGVRVEVAAVQIGPRRQVE